MKKVICFLMVICLGLLIFCLYPLFNSKNKIDFPFLSEINGAGMINMRSEASVESDVLLQLPEGQKVQVEDIVEGQEVFGQTSWAKVKIQVANEATEGYVHLSYLGKVPDYTELLPVTMAERLQMRIWEAQGFNTEQRKHLLLLHRLFPYWQFKGIKHPFTLEEVVAEQYQPGTGKNLIPLNSDEEDISEATADLTADGYYVQYEPGWVAPSKTALRRQLTATNFLNLKHIWQYEALDFQGSNISKEQLRAVLAKTFMAGDEPVVYTDATGAKRSLTASYTDIIWRAAKEANVSPLYLVSRILQEVGIESSPSVSGTVAEQPGYYNFYNIGATAGEDPVLNGLRFAAKGYSDQVKNKLYQLPWTDPEKSIVGGAKFISEEYIASGQNTLFYQKFDLNAGLGKMHHQYMANILGPENEATHTYEHYLSEGLIAYPHDFYIPLYR